MPQPMGTKLIGAGRYERVLIGRLSCYPIGGGLPPRAEAEKRFRADQATNGLRFDLTHGEMPLRLPETQS